MLHHVGVVVQSSHGVRMVVGLIGVDGILYSHRSGIFTQHEIRDQQKHLVPAGVSFSAHIAGKKLALFKIVLKKFNISLTSEQHLGFKINYRRG